MRETSMTSVVHPFVRMRAWIGLMACVATGVAANESPDLPIPAKAVTCVACHGADGIGKAPQYPNLQGQKAEYLSKQLKAFRSGERKDSNMNALARPLSDADIAELSAYFQRTN